MRKFQKNQDRDTSHEVSKVRREIDSLQAAIERNGFGSYEAMRAENQIRHLRARLNRLNRG